MNICIIGDGLTGLSLAKNLTNKKIDVHFYHKNKIKNLTSSRTIGISRNNLEFYKKEIYEIPKKIFWQIKKIEIYSEKLNKERLLKFEDKKDNLFYMLKNDELYKLLMKDLSNNEYFKKKLIKNDSSFKDLLKKNKYDLIINCDLNNFFSKKFFIKKIDKNYENLAYTTILSHQKLKNNVAIQIFTKNGPIAFLPISNNETSIVCSLDTKNKKYNDYEVLELINKNNPKYQVQKKLKLSSFKLSSSNLRNYYHQNILAFGDLLHRIHPLAGQGFNMTIRDIKILSKIIQNKIDLGIQLDESILSEFEKETKIKNFIFSNSVDLIYEVFNLDKKIKNKSFNKILKIIGKNKGLTNYFIKIADKGLNF
ncbi:2-octaprenyl-3-methyl-6-methoxy-1,4-benzoquinol hydroxylase [Candidatus Pelagibacter ubique]|uniref:2-octaprenyl-3-methyl-6-methoxy-1,4-benzoquinol hydroxylase n=1 Tax=Pelagibacter ubique TaxID=198252 RepID=A0ABX1T356_PELUQ|nr:FAD-dependent monooxygenase [Candidatus Pelagibacter ubique]NMN67311.1 2-octaprenyl-3-methyl-6-methoxy-1,4-benzoquinol hydroxylase [Candidatus Pelagibacter ubique]